MASMEWELSKENVQPLRKGRQVEVLNATLKTKEEGPTRANIFENQRKEMIQAIDSYEGDDPLHPWLQCIRWVKDAFPSGGAQSELLPLLEACTRTFQSDERYKPDLRYLRVWVEYADCCTEPRDIFPFLEVHSIGQDHALFYEAYATYMEVCKKYSKANEIYELGMQRGAQPALRLQNMYQSFLKRMMKRNERKHQEDQDDSFEPEKLRMFGESRTSHSSIPARNPPSFQEQQRRRVQAPQIQRPGIAVYVDAEFQPGSHSSFTPQSAHAHAPAAPAWKNLGTQKEIRKENSQVPAKWTEIKVPRMGKVPKHVTAHPAINVYVDEECEVAQARMKTKDESAVPATLRLRLDGVPDHRRDQEALNKNPLLHFADGVKPSLTALMGRRPADSNEGAHGDDAASTATLTAAPELIGSKIYKSREDTRESSFKDHQNPTSSPRNSVEKAKLIEKSLNMFRSESARRRSHSPSTKSTDSPSASDHPFSLSSICDRGTECSPQSALLGNSSMSTSEESSAYPMPPQLSWPSPSSASSISSIDDPPAFHCTMPISQNGGALAPVASNGEETVAIKRYAEELITLGADPNAKTIDAVGHQGLVDQTINTKECLQDILSMFNRPLSCEKQPRPRNINRARPAPTSNEGFQVFVDEDLDAPALKNNTAQKNKTFEVFRDEENVPRKPGKVGSEVDKSKKTFKVYNDEEVIVARPPARKPTSAPARRALDVFVDEDLDAPSKVSYQQGKFSNSIKVFEDAVGPAAWKATKGSTSGPAKGGRQVFVDEDLDTKPQEKRVPASRGKESFAIFEDEVLPAPKNVARRIPKSKPMGKPKAGGFTIFED